MRTFSNSKAASKERGGITGQQGLGGRQGAFVIPGFLAYQHPAWKQVPCTLPDATADIQDREGRRFFARQTLMPAQPELLLAAKPIEVTRFGEVGVGFHGVGRTARTAALLASRSDFQTRSSNQPEYDDDLRR